MAKQTQPGIKSIGLHAIVERAYQKHNITERVPERITQDELAKMIKRGIAFTASPVASVVGEQIMNAGDKIVILPLEHRIWRAMSDEMVKDVNPSNFLYLNNADIIQQAVRYARDYHGPRFSMPQGLTFPTIERLTETLAQSTGMFPSFLLRAAVDLWDKENPPIGFYWVGNDNRKRVVTWMRAINALQIYKAFEKDAYQAKFDEQLYGDTITAEVPSFSKIGRTHSLTLRHIPVFSRADPEQYSYWMKLSTNDTSADAGYRGLAHNRGETDNIFFTSNSIFAYFAVMARLKGAKERKQVQVNPFPILYKHGHDYLQRLSEQVLIGTKEPNLTEMDALIGAELMATHYRHLFRNWKDTAKIGQ